MYGEVTPSRRKSCEACKRAKRRCDLAFPFCSRCVRRNEPCAYPGSQPSAIPQFDDELPSLLDTSKGPWQMLALTSPLAIANDACPPTTVTSNYLDPMAPQLGYANHASLVQLPTTKETITLPNLELALPRTRPLRPLSETIASHLQFAIDILKDTPKRLVLENQTPWCHAHLYRHQMPKAMQG